MYFWHDVAVMVGAQTGLEASDGWLLRFGSDGEFDPDIEPSRARAYSFAVKDNIDLAGRVTRAGCPAWAKGRAAAEHDAESVARAKRAGARFAGVVCMDELAYGIEGINIHDGVPRNPHDPARVCGGSSCGPARVVAAGEVDFALGTDTAGSVRVPAAYCGLWGMRPTHRSLAGIGVTPLAPSFDTLGYFARDFRVFEWVARMRIVGAQVCTSAAEPGALCVWEDGCMGLDAAVERSFESSLTRLATQGCKLDTHGAAGSGSGSESAPGQWRAALAHRQGREVAAIFGGWWCEGQRDVAPWIRARLETAMALDPAGDDDALDVTQRCRAWAQRWRKRDCVLLFPTVPTVAPRIDATQNEREELRVRTMEHVALASLLGWPQMTLPLAQSLRCASTHLPVSISLLAGPNREHDLWAWARRLIAAGVVEGRGRARM